MTIKMAASHARWPQGDDINFFMSNKANEAINKYGKENIINATLGAMYDDNGELIAINSVFDTLKEMDNDLIASYAPIAGTKEFQKNVIDVCFGENKPDAYIRAIATPGGTGAIRHSIWNYTEVKDYVICPDWYWKPYEMMCEEFDRQFVSYPLFNEDLTFNLEKFEKTFVEYLNKNNRILSILNTPANNPTGYSLSDYERDRVLEIIKREASNIENKITLLIDVAYIEYAGNGEQKLFFKKLSNLPENVFVIITYSMSKAFTMYGLRSGAAIGISSNEEIANEFFYSLSHSNRCNWSNGTHSAMNILVELNENSEKKKLYLEELSKYNSLLRKRADAFIKSASESDLKTIPYFGGFFITIPLDNAKLVSEKLEAENIFGVPYNKGLRFAICSVSEEKCRLAPKIIKRVIDSINK